MFKTCDVMCEDLKTGFDLQETGWNLNCGTNTREDHEFKVWSLILYALS
jgi:hypothetical protein